MPSSWQGGILSPRNLPCAISTVASVIVSPRQGAPSIGWPTRCFFSEHSQSAPEGAPQRAKPAGTLLVRTHPAERFPGGPTVESPRSVKMILTKPQESVRVPGMVNGLEVPESDEVKFEILVVSLIPMT